MDIITPACNGWCNQTNVVTHIGNKGYIYCTECALRRRESGYEGTRKLHVWEIKLIEQGQQVPSYTYRGKPVSA